MQGYSWKGNVRELKNKIEAYYVFYPDHKDFDVNCLELEGASQTNNIELPETGISLEELEKNFLKRALDIAKGNKTKASKLLGLTRHSFNYRLEKYDLKTLMEEKN